MGSSGSGHFSDYSSARTVNKKESGTGSGGGGGASGTDKCRQAFSVVLEEVAQCELYAKSKTLPPPGSSLGIVLSERLFAVDSNGVRVGALPTSLNYLAACLADGIVYVGVVNSSTATPMPSVEADFAAK